MRTAKFSSSSIIALHHCVSIIALTSHCPTTRFLCVHASCCFWVLCFYQSFDMLWSDMLSESPCGVGIYALFLKLISDKIFTGPFGWREVSREDTLHPQHEGRKDLVINQVVYSSLTCSFSEHAQENIARWSNSVPRPELLISIVQPQAFKQLFIFHSNH